MYEEGGFLYSFNHKFGIIEAIKLKKEHAHVFLWSSRSLYIPGWVVNLLELTACKKTLKKLIGKR